MTVIDDASQPASRRSAGRLKATPAELRRWLDALAEISRAVNRGLQLDELLDILAATTCHLTGYSHCAILLRDTGGYLRVRGSYGLSRAYVEDLNERNPISTDAGRLGQGPSSRAYRTQRPVTLADIAADPTCARWEPIVAEQGVASLACVPITGGGETLGVLNCYTTAAQQFGATEIVLLETIANQAAIAIEANRLRCRERSRIEELELLNARLEDQRRWLERAQQTHERLMEVLLEDRTLASVAAVLSQTLGCTVQVEDGHAHQVAAAVDGAGSGQLPDGYRDRPDVAAALVQLQSGRRIVDLPDDPSAGVGAVVVAPVIVDGELAGRLWAYRPGPFDDFERRTLERGAVVTAVALQSMRTAQETEWRLSREFFDELIEAGRTAADGERLIERGLHLGIDLRQPHAVLAVRVDASDGGAEGPAARHTLSAVGRTVGNVPVRGISAARPDHVVLVWPAGDPDEVDHLATRLRDEMAAYGPAGDVTVVVSAACRSIADYEPAYRTVLTALHLRRRQGSGSRVVRVPDLGIYGLLMNVRHPEDLADFAASTLEPLRRYDTANQTNLVATLRTWIEQRCNSARTAEVLFVHPNTIVYRLHRIRALTGMNANDLEFLLRYELAFLIEALIE